MNTRLFKEALDALDISILRQLGSLIAASLHRTVEYLILRESPLHHNPHP
jgi:hypothetical protein